MGLFSWFGGRVVGGLQQGYSMISSEDGTVSIYNHYLRIRDLVDLDHCRFLSCHKVCFGGITN